MTDVVSPEVRSRMMSGIRGKDTKPEMIIRSSLHKLGFRFRLHSRSLPGKPDMALRKYQAVLFVNGCFWHGHECVLFKWPKTRPKFWREKIGGNKKRDTDNRRALLQDGWRVCTIWECALKGPARLPIEEVIEATASWITSNGQELEIDGDRSS